MRKNQITIQVERFGDQVPERLRKQGADHIRFGVYCDSNNIYEALSGAFYQVLEELQKDEKLPSFGDRSSCSDPRVLYNVPHSE